MIKVIAKTSHIKSFLSNPEGLVLLALEGCPPCNRIWDKLLEYKYLSMEMTKLVFDGKDRDHRELIRSLKIDFFPTISYFSANAEVSRLSGVPFSEVNHEAIKYIFDNLELSAYLSMKPKLM